MESEKATADCIREQQAFEASLATECDMLETEWRALRGDPPPTEGDGARPAEDDGIGARAAEGDSTGTGTGIGIDGPPTAGNGATSAAAERWRAWRRRVEAEPPMAALCLSGGGIRSATFSLGVLQGLAKRGILRDFDYLSTVSGGGYIGAFLSAWIARTSIGEVEATLRQPVTSPPAARSNPIGNLRAYSNYLSPTWGLSGDFLTLVATYLRNITLTWLQLVPLMAAVLLMPRLYLALLAWSRGDGWWPSHVVESAPTAATLLVAVSLGYMLGDLRLGSAERRPPRNCFVQGCLMPLMAAAVLGSVCMARGAVLPVMPPAWSFALYGAVLHLLALVAAPAWRDVRRIVPIARIASPAVIAYLLISGMGGGLLVHQALLLLHGLAATAHGTWPSPRVDALYALVCVPVALAGFWLVNTIAAGFTQRWTADGYREWWARAGGASLGFAAAWCVLFAIVLHGPPLVLEALAKRLPDGGSGGTLALASGAVGLATSAIGFWSRNGGRVRQMASRFGTHVLELAAGAFVLSLALCLCQGLATAIEKIDQIPVPALPCRTAGAGADVSIKLERISTAKIELSAGTPAPCANAAGKAAAITPAQEAQRYRLTLAPGHGAPAWWIFLGSLGLCALVSLFFGTNVFSLHGMYKNRLERAYLGATKQRRRPHWFTGFDDHDNLAMTRLAGDPHRHRGRVRLLPVINIALNLTRPSRTRLAWQQRKAASFTVTPHFCGSSTLGYVPTSDYADRPTRHDLDAGTGPGDPNVERHKGFTLARAMAISGAAASPNMGYHTSTLVAFVMTFFNLRLGWWAPNPRPPERRPGTAGDRSSPTVAALAGGQDQRVKREPTFSLWPILSELAGQSSEENSWVYLSDGGHFENLALYEMVRRRCRRILVVDAGADADYKYEDLENALRKIRIDFGVPIEFEGRPLPRPRTSREEWKRRVVIGVIRYDLAEPGCRTGALVLIKPVLMGDEPLDVLRYAASRPPGSPPFPQEPTSDQFFSEAQFESYRALGELAVLQDLDWPAAGPGDGSARSASPPSPLPPLPAAQAAPPAASPRSGTGETAGVLAGAARGVAVVAGAGVVGFGVAHFSGEVRLDADDRVLLSTPVKVEASSVKLDGGSAQLIKDGIRLDRDSADLIKGGLKVDPSLLTALTDLTTRLAKLIDKLPGTANGTEVKIDVEAIRRVLEQVKLQVVLAPGQDGHLQNIEDALGTLEGTLLKVENLLVTITVAGPASAGAARDPRVDVNLASLLKELKVIELRLSGATPSNAVRATPAGGQ